MLACAPGAKMPPKTTPANSAIKLRRMGKRIVVFIWLRSFVCGSQTAGRSGSCWSSERPAQAIIPNSGPFGFSGSDSLADLLVMAAAAEQAAFGTLRAYDLHQVRIVHDIKGRPQLVVHIVAAGAFHTVPAPQQKSIDGHVVSRHKLTAIGCQHW